MDIQELTRVFKYNSVDLPDPSTAFTIAQVRDFYANVYPEIVNAEIEGPVVKGSKNVYTFRRAVGTKGGHDLAKMVADLVGLVQIGWLTESDADLIKSIHERSTGQVYVPPVADIVRVIALHNEYCTTELKASATAVIAQAGAA